MTSFVLPLDKPVGPTSHDMVNLARRALNTRRVGHTGTLDPFASGLLLLCVGEATRLAEYLTGLPKRYTAVARLDGRTTTDDHTGERVATSAAWQTLAVDAVRAAFEDQRGEILQRPSTYSAKKIGGRRAYELARGGAAVELEPVAVMIDELRVTRIDPPEVEFEVACSSGTYVRAIARDAGEQLGTGGYLAALRRTGVGAYNVANSLAPAELMDAERVAARRVTLLAALDHLPALEVSEAEERALRFGQQLERAAPAGAVALSRSGRLVAIGIGGGTVVRPRKVFSND